MRRNEVINEFLGLFLVGVYSCPYVVVLGFWVYAILGMAAEPSPAPVGEIAVPVGLTAASEKPISVHVWTEDGTAVAGRDYEAIDVVQTGDAVSTQGLIRISVLPDDVAEPDEDFMLNVQGIDNVSTETMTVRCVILDNDENPGIWIEAPEPVVED